MNINVPALCIFFPDSSKHRPRFCEVVGAAAWLCILLHVHVSTRVSKVHIPSSLSGHKGPRCIMSHRIISAARYLGRFHLPLLETCGHIYPVQMTLFSHLDYYLRKESQWRMTKSKAMSGCIALVASLQLILQGQGQLQNHQQYKRFLFTNQRCLYILLSLSDIMLILHSC